MCATCGCGADEVQVDGAPIQTARHVHPVHDDGQGHGPGSAQGPHGHAHHTHDEHHQHAHAHHHHHHGPFGHHHHGPGHAHAHPHEHILAPDSDPPQVLPGGGRRLVDIEQEVLAKNDALAMHNRRWLAERRVFAFNLLGSPGVGKTTLLERTIRALGPTPVSVLEGDQETSRDADRIRATGAAAVQINTGRGCHLDAAMVGSALPALAPPQDSLLLIENVGNLVCPSLFDLGEQCKVVLLSVTEGEDKPLKYPHAFRSAGALVITKTDLLPHVTFDLDRCLEYARRVNPNQWVFCLSAQRGDGLGAWCDWLRAGLPALSRGPGRVGSPAVS